MKKNDKLIVASYSSFAGQWGVGEIVVSDFEKESGIQVELIDAGSGSELAKAIRDDKIKADVVIGIDETLLEGVVMKFDSHYVFDYGFYAFCFNNDFSIKKPTCLEDLAKSEYKNTFVLIDPRSSNVGLGLLKWADAAFDGDVKEWLSLVFNNALTVTASWSEAYGLFTSGEVPLVLSFSTSPVYHYMEKDFKYESLIFENGSIRTEEFIAIMNNSKKKKDAQFFIDYVLENSAKIALCNVMYPVRGEENLPSEYNLVKKPEKILKTGNSNKLLEIWEDAIF